MIRPGSAACLAALCAALAPLLPACRPAGGGRGAGRDSTTVAIDPATAEGQVALELWQLRAGTTLGEWKGVHPDEPILGSDTTTLARRFLGPWCGFARRRWSAGTLALTRTAYFYPPPPPPGLAVPDTGALDLARQCVIGLVWVDLEAPDSGTGAALADSVRRQLGRLYGAEQSRPPRFFGSAFWSRSVSFAHDSLTAALALRTPAAGSSPSPPLVVTAFALLPVSGISISSDALPSGAWSPVDTFPLDSALAIAALDTSLAAPLKAALNDESATPGDSLVAALTDWLAAATTLAPPRRAAALYVADQVLDRAMCLERLCEKASERALAPLKALGARFSWAELAGTLVYHRSWLMQARVLSRDSPLGERILLAQLLAGFDFSGTCAGGPESFRRVIDNGERYLARLPASPIAPEVHYLVGDAWRDIVALAHGAGGRTADSAQYAAESAEAARQALGHYVAAMQAGAGHPAARAAWTRAWWLRAGLLPRDVRFVCQYE